MPSNHQPTTGNRQPIFSIITIVYNGENVLKGTICSVINQTFQNYEYIIIDGASKDKTLDIIEKYADKITKIISEPDKGLYDAMNKGLNLATGDFVLFLNAGDRFYSNNVLEHIAAKITDDTDIIYGETMLVNDNREELGTRSEKTTHRLPENLTWKSFSYGMSVCHQSIFVHRTMTSHYIEKNLAADIDWIITAMKKSRITVNAHLIVSAYLVGGVSKQKLKQSLKDRFFVLQKHYGVLPNIFNHVMIALKALKYFVIGAFHNLS